MNTNARGPKWVASPWLYGLYSSETTRGDPVEESRWHRTGPGSLPLSTLEGGSKEPGRYVVSLGIRASGEKPLAACSTFSLNLLLIQRLES